MSQFKANKAKAFGNRFKKLFDGWKEANGFISTEQLAERIGVQDRASVSRWLNGKVIPNRQNLQQLADFFSVPVSYLLTDDHLHELTKTDEEAHRILEEQCRRAADRFGLSPAFVSFLKECPDIVDMILKASWVSTEAQSVDPSVPEMDGSLFQIVGRSGVKIYPPDEVLLMLSLVQRETIEVIQFFIQKRMGTITDYYQRGEGPPPERVYWLESQGMSGLSDDEASMISILRLMDGKGRKAMAEHGARIVHRIRKEQRERDR